MRTGLRGTLVIDERSPEGELPLPPPLPFFLLCLFLGTLFSQADRLLLRAQDWSWGSRRAEISLWGGSGCSLNCLCLKAGPETPLLEPRASCVKVGSGLVPTVRR